MKQKIIAALYFLVVVYTASGQMDTAGNYILVGPEDFLTLIRFREDAVLIDVRLPFEYRKGHIEKSINIPLRLSHKNFIRKVSSIPHDRTILLYCESDVRSISAAQRMYNAGYRSIYVLDGGISAWKRKYLPLEKGRRRKEKP